MAYQQDAHNNSTGIPLHCNVCPKKPDFSDVSHLLTHIASKGHLSNYYKLKIKATSDRGAQRITEEYDRWYEAYNVQDLMGERMKQKEKRKGSGGSGSGGGSARRASAASTARNTPAYQPYPDRRRGLRESTLDPQLGHGPRIKVEPDSRSGTPYSAPSIDPASLSRSFMPPMMQSWPATPYAADSPLTQEPSIFDSFNSSPSSDWEDSDAPRRSTRKRRRPRNVVDSDDCVGYDDEEEGLEYDDGLNENTKLKGVYWEGMGIFDSATPDMRRKRNQKKAYSVIRSLMATSEVVEATELVFDADGELHRERTITGNPNEDDGMDPLPGEEMPEISSPPKKKPTVKRARPALNQKHVNTGRVVRGRDSHHPSNKSFGRTPYYDGADEDDDLTYGAPRPRKRTGLSIHRDNSGPDITFDNPAPMSTLNSGFRPRSMSGAPRGQSMFHNGRSSFNNNYTHQRLPSLNGAGHSGFRPSNMSSFGNLGQFTGQSTFQNGHFQQNPFANMVTSGANALAAFQHHMGGMGLGQQNPFNNEAMFHAPTRNLVQPAGA